MGEEENLIFVGITETKTGQRRYIYYNPKYKMTINLAKPIEDYDYSKAQPPSEEIRKHYTSEVYFVKDVKETEKGYDITFEQIKKVNPFLEQKKAEDEAFKQKLIAMSEKLRMPVSDTGIIVVPQTPPYVQHSEKKKEKPPTEQKAQTNVYEGYEKYYEGLYALDEQLNEQTNTPSVSEGAVRHRTHGVGQVDTEEAVKEWYKNIQENENKIVTASGAIYKKLGIENEPYTGSPEDRWARLQWATSETLKDVAQGAIGAVTFPVDIALLLVQREKFKDITWEDIKMALWESAKTGELGAEITGGILVGGAISAVRGAVSGGSKSITSSLDDIVRKGASNLDDIADDVAKAGVKNNIDDVVKKVTGVSDDIVKGHADDLLERGITREEDLIKLLEKEGYQIKKYPGYIKVQKGEDILEIYAKGGVFDVKTQGNVKELDKIVNMLSNTGKTTMDDVTKEVTKQMLDEWKGLYEPQNVLDIMSDPKLRDLFNMRFTATSQKLLLKETGKEASKKIIYVDAPPEWKAMKKALEKAGVSDDLLIASVGGAAGATNLAVQRASDNKNNDIITPPQVPESVQRNLNELLNVQNQQEGQTGGQGQGSGNIEVPQVKIIDLTEQGGRGRTKTETRPDIKIIEIEKQAQKIVQEEASIPKQAQRTKTTTRVTPKLAVPAIALGAGMAMKFTPGTITIPKLMPGKGPGMLYPRGVSGLIRTPKLFSSGKWKRGLAWLKNPFGIKKKSRRKSGKRKKKVGKKGKKRKKGGRKRAKKR